MFEKKHKLLAKEHALRNAIQFLDVILKHKVLEPEKLKSPELLVIVEDIARKFEAYIRGEDFLKENSEFASAGDLFGEKRSYSNVKNAVQNKSVRRRN